MTTEETQAPVQTVLKYADLLAQSKDQKDAEERSIQVEEAKQELESATTNTRRSLLAAKRRLAQLKGTFPFDVEAIMRAQVEVSDYEQGLKGLEVLKSELF